MPEPVSSKKKAADPEPAEEMSFWGHLDALRGHLFRSALAIIVLGIVAFINREFIFDTLILAPKEPEFITNRLLCKLATWANVPSLCLGT
jgi:sec-independent protein translocase protein TatC